MLPRRSLPSSSGTDLRWRLEEKLKPAHTENFLHCHWWRRRRSHCLVEQRLKMRNAGNAPTDTPRLIRLMNCLKSNRCYRSSVARHVRPCGDSIRLRHPALIKSWAAHPTVRTCAPARREAKAAFERSFHFSDKSPATLEAALDKAVTSALATTWRCAVPSGYRLRQ